MKTLIESFDNLMSRKTLFILHNLNPLWIFRWYRNDEFSDIIFLLEKTSSFLEQCLLAKNKTSSILPTVIDKRYSNLLDSRVMVLVYQLSELKNKALAFELSVFNSSSDKDFIREKLKRISDRIEETSFHEQLFKVSVSSRLDLF